MGLVHVDGLFVVVLSDGNGVVLANSVPTPDEHLARLDLQRLSAQVGGRARSAVAFDTRVAGLLTLLVSDASSEAWRESLAIPLATDSAVLLTLRRTVPGETLSYADLAERALKSRKAARAVGTCMARNPFPLLVPCHRVLPVSGKIGRYSGAGGATTKRQLIDMEANVSKGEKKQKKQ